MRWVFHASVMPDDSIPSHEKWINFICEVPTPPTAIELPDLWYQDPNFFGDLWSRSGRAAGEGVQVFSLIAPPGSGKTTAGLWVAHRHARRFSCRLSLSESCECLVSPTRAFFDWLTLGRGFTHASYSAVRSRLKHIYYFLLFHLLQRSLFPDAAPTELSAGGAPFSRFLPFINGEPFLLLIDEIQTLSSAEEPPVARPSLVSLRTESHDLDMLRLPALGDALHMITQSLPTLRVLLTGTVAFVPRFIRFGSSCKVQSLCTSGTFPLEWLREHYDHCRRDDTPEEDWNMALHVVSSNRRICSGFLDFYQRNVAVMEALRLAEERWRENLPQVEALSQHCAAFLSRIVFASDDQLAAGCISGQSHPLPLDLSHWPDR